MQSIIIGISRRTKYWNSTPAYVFTTTCSERFCNSYNARHENSVVKVIIVLYSVSRKQIEKFGLEKKWEETKIAQKIRKQKRRAQLNDYERFQVMVLKRQVIRIIKGKKLNRNPSC